MSDFISPEVWSGFLLGFKYLYAVMPIWLPAIFLVLVFKAWVDYKRAQFWQKQDSILLEIRLPKEITKSPVAMEMVYNAFFHTVGESTFIDRIFRGKTRNWFSLELVSLGGVVHFYIWTRVNSRNLIESQIYSQYPGIEIHEATDYTKPYYYNPKVNNVWGCEWKLTSPDAMPIKTYIDYGMEKDPKEEFKIDPMTPFIEFLGSLTSGHTVWMQVIIRAHRKRRLADIFGEKEDTWKE